MKSLQLRSGLTLRYEARGPGVSSDGRAADAARVAAAGQGDPILCLHGYSDSWYSFDALMSRLPAEIRAIALSQRGHGDSDRPDEGYLVEDFARDAIDALDQLEIARAVVVGHSMGSFVAQEVAMLAPERVSRLVLIGSATTGDNPGIRELAGAVEDLSDPIAREFVHEFQASTLAQPIDVAVLATIVDESLKVPARVWQAAAAGLLAFRSGDRLDAITAPTLLVWGDRDEVFGRDEQDALVAGISRASLEVYRGAGHGVHWEEPKRVASDIVAFLRG